MRIQLGCAATVIVTLLLAENSFAQDRCGCAAALDANLLDVFEYRMGTAGSFTSRSAMCDEANSTSTEDSSADGSISVGTFDLGGGASRARTASDFKKICSDEFQQGDDDQKLSVLRRSVNPTLAQGFNQCILACSNDEFGFKVERREQILSINIFNKRGENKIHHGLVRVIDELEDVDEGEKVECRLHVGSNNISVPKSVESERPEQLQNGLAISEGSAIVTCTRDIASASMGEKSVKFLPGYTLALGVGDKLIVQDVPTKPIGSLTSPEFDQIQSTLSALRLAIATDLETAATSRAAIKGVQDRIVGARWQDVISSRRAGTNYTNSRDYPIVVAVIHDSHIYGAGERGNPCSVSIVVDGATTVSQRNNNKNWNKVCSATAVVPPGSSYRVVTNAHLGPQNDPRVKSWKELY